MYLNTLSPNPGRTSDKKRVGRGIGSGYGKTCGRGHKGQKARTGGKVAPGFEGGQMPLRKRLPKFGFTSRVGMVSAEVRLSELNKVDAKIIDLEALKRADLVGQHIEHAKVFASGELKGKVTVQGLRVSKGARAAIEAAGGTILDVPGTDEAPVGKLKAKTAAPKKAAAPKKVAAPKEAAAPKAAAPKKAAAKKAAPKKVVPKKAADKDAAPKESGE